MAAYLWLTVRAGRWSGDPWTLSRRQVGPSDVKRSTVVENVMTTPSEANVIPLKSRQKRSQSLSFRGSCSLCTKAVKPQLLGSHVQT